METKRNSEAVTIPYVVYENAMARNERHIIRLWIALIISILMIAASNVSWLIYMNQYDFCSYELSTDGGGNANYIGNDGDIHNGEN